MKEKRLIYLGNLFYYETPIGEIGIAETNDKITHLFFKHEELEELNEKNQELVETPILAEAARQLKEYFDGKRHKLIYLWRLKAQIYDASVESTANNTLW